MLCDKSVTTNSSNKPSDRARSTLALDTSPTIRASGSRARRRLSAGTDTTRVAEHVRPLDEHGSRRLLEQSAAAWPHHARSPVDLVVQRARVGGVGGGDRVIAVRQRGRRDTWRADENLFNVASEDHFRR